jgi:hypothetical protein
MIISLLKVTMLIVCVLLDWTLELIYVAFGLHQIQCKTAVKMKL